MIKKYFKNLTILVLVLGLTLPLFSQRPEKERLEFKQLMEKNLNYFGTFPELKLKPVKLMMYNTTYEELKCLGFYPEANLMEAVVDVKLPFGYSGDLCKPGSYEYVRFFADWNGDNDFTDPGEDAGLTSVNVHDIPNKQYPCLTRISKPLSYSLSIQVSPRKYSCPEPYLVKVRVILSWNHEPTPGNPNYIPVWGNRLEGWIQIKPYYKYVLKRAVEKVDLEKVKKLTPEELELMPLPKMKTLKAEELKMIYQDKQVPELRFNLSRVTEIAQKIKAQPALKAKLMMDPKLSKIVDLTKFVLAPSPNTTYEQLTCVGLNYHQSKMEATLIVKKPYGYSGELCKAQGSYEYVAFWAYVMTPKTGRCSWKYLGTAKVKVHDIPGIPNEGLHYAVTQSVDLSSLQDKCANPVVIKVRGILSWEKEPPHGSPADADWPPVWGNRLDKFIQVKPGPIVSPTEQKPFIWSIGRMPVEGIAGNAYTLVPSSLGDGYANGASPAPYTALESPFGYRMTISGTITHPPDDPTEPQKLKYKLQYRMDGTAYWHILTNKFPLWIRINGVPSGYIWQSVDSDGYYTYQKDVQGPYTVETQEDILGYWYTPVADGDGLYEFQMLFKKPATTTDIPSEVIKVMVDNTMPLADISLTAGACSLFQIGDPISGEFTAWDKHLWKYNIFLEPYAPSPGSFTHQPNPPAGPTYNYGVIPVYPALPVPGTTNGKYNFNTSGMPQCGYIFKIHVWDRAIRNDSMWGPHASKSVGFCLLEKK